MWLPSSSNGQQPKPVVLKGRRARIYKLGASSLVAAIDAREDAASGVGLFDKLRTDQQIVLLADVSRALLDRKVPAPPVTAMRDLAVWAAFRRAGLEAVAELQVGTGTGIRKLIIEGERKAGFRRVLTLHACDPDSWVDETELLCGRYIRESAAEDYEEALDNRRLAAFRREGYGLPADYFVVPPPDPTAEEVEQAKLVLAQMAQAVAQTNKRR